ncbi:MAG: methyltransferase domain-containing protein [Bacteroidota bacterium]
MSRVKCGNCDIVFANPMADENELVSFYTNYYHKGNFGLLNYVDLTVNSINEARKLSEPELKAKAWHIYDYKHNGRFLDIGCGLGAGLMYVDQSGFELFATDFDADALSFVQSHYHNVKTHKGELMSAAYPDDYFDYIYCNHVIEHVLDPTAYINEMYRILKKDGVLYIGTPDRLSYLYRIYRTVKFLSLSIPRIIDGIEHTFIFSKRNLSSLLTKKGFSIEFHKSIPLRSSFKDIFRSDMSFKKKISRYGQTYFKINQELICRK